MMKNGVYHWDDQKQFEFLMMEVMQCGLNWNMMIQKREIFRVLQPFDFDQVAAFGEENIERILQTEGMIRSRRKVEAVIHDAKCFRISGRSLAASVIIYGHLQMERPTFTGIGSRVFLSLGIIFLM